MGSGSRVLTGGSEFAYPCQESFYSHGNTLVRVGYLARAWFADPDDNRYAGLFVCTATMGGGQETTALNAMSTLAHHGMIFVPLGYKTTFGILADMSEVRGGSAWGAGTFAVSPSLQLIALTSIGQEIPDVPVN